jgi:hypothetical protein
MFLFVSDIKVAISILSSNGFVNLEKEVLDFSEIRRGMKQEEIKSKEGRINNFDFIVKRIPKLCIQLVRYSF